MKVILQETMEGVGQLGDLITVARRICQEFPAASAQSGRSQQPEHQSLRPCQTGGGGEGQEGKAGDRNPCQEAVGGVANDREAQAGKDDKMFGSVTSKDIAEGLAAQGFTVDRRKIQLAHPIKELGTVTVPIKMPRDVMATGP